MSDLDEMELDVTRFHKGLFDTKESLEFLKRKYIRYPDLVKEIDKRIKDLKEEEQER